MDRINSISEKAEVFSTQKNIFLNSLLFDLRNQSDLKTELTDLLEKIITFIVAISLPSGDILQIGDNDSGSLIKIGCSYEKLGFADLLSREFKC